MLLCGDIVQSSYNALAKLIYTQFDQNGIVYDPKTNCKYRKNGVFTAVYDVNMVRYRSVLDRIMWRRNTHRIVSVS